MSVKMEKSGTGDDSFKNGFSYFCGVWKYSKQTIYFPKYKFLKTQNGGKIAMFN